MSELRLIGQEDNLGIVRESLASARRGNGKIVCVSGDAGFGKTAILNEIFSETNVKTSGIVSVSVQCHPPVGRFNIGNIKPLMPFQKAVEQLISGQHLTPEKRLAFNLGMTALASIPLIGDIFYIVKESGRDWRQFKRDKSSMTARKVSSASADFYDTIRAYTEKSPLALLIDDMHYADAQSIELLNLFAENLNAIPLSIILTYRQNELQNLASPFIGFLNKNKGKSDLVYNIELEKFSKSNINTACKMTLPNYKTNSEIEDWLMGKSYGVPGVVFEYLKYFIQNSPFNTDGSIKVEAFNQDVLPSSLHSTFIQIISKLTEEERNTLAVCSAEGREFTALVVSNLLNTDVLTTIKKLRSLQLKTGVIKSLGANVRYGVKTTMYQFTQAFYHSFFEKTLEFEEHTALHGQIAALLKDKYNDAEIDEVREQIAPYLAAHSAESGDEETARSMLLFTAQNAQKYGSAEFIKDVYDNYVNVGLETPGTQSEELESDNLVFQEMIKNTQIEYTPQINDNGEAKQEASDNGSQLNYTDFITARKAIVMEYHKERYDIASELALSFFNNHPENLSDSEKAQLLALAAKSQIELKDFITAEENINNALTLNGSNPDPITECFLLNTQAILCSSKNEFKEAYKYLQKAAKKVIGLPPELRLLTITNIAIVLKEKSPESASAYYEAAKKLSESLRYQPFI